VQSHEISSKMQREKYIISSYSVLLFSKDECSCSDPSKQSVLGGTGTPHEFSMLIKSLTWNHYRIAN
jgi:hypothetical protein